MSWGAADFLGGRLFFTSKAGGGQDFHTHMEGGPGIFYSLRRGAGNFLATCFPKMCLIRKRLMQQ